MDIFGRSLKPLLPETEMEDTDSSTTTQKPVTVAKKEAKVTNTQIKGKVKYGDDPLNMLKSQNERKIQQRAKPMQNMQKLNDKQKAGMEHLFGKPNIPTQTLKDITPTPTPTPSPSTFTTSIPPRYEVQEETEDYAGKPKFVKGDFFSDPEVIQRNCRFLPAETFKDVARATYKTTDKAFIGILVLTNFRVIFKFQDPKNERMFGSSEDYLKFPIFNILKIEKTQDNRQSYEAYPIDIFLKDTRVLRFHIYNKFTQNFFNTLVNAVIPRDKNIIFEYTKLYGKIATQGFFNGWDIYNPMKEYIRQGITENNDLNLRFSLVNQDFTLCPTYPCLLVTHKDMTDENLWDAAQYRSKGRLPVLSYYYKGNRDVPNPTKSSLSSTPSIWRCSQNKGGLIGNKRNDSDEKLMNCCVSLCAKLFILDARPYINALANRVNGGGFENMKNYKNVELNFCGIENIHAAKGSLNKMYQLSLSSKIMENQKFWSSLEATGWYQFINLILQHSHFISETLQKNYSVLIHCSDGWDRTAQLVSTAQMLLDPYFRTIEGLAVLVEKDWVSFGHQFGLRNGISFKDQGEDQRAPIFLQWLDVVHQLIYQFPNAFEFNVELLLFLAKNYSTNLYGTFMYNSDKERRDRNAKTTSASVWTDVMKNVSKYKNVYYNSQNPVKILSPNYAPYNLHFWSDLFMENNIDLENNKFYLSDIDHSVYFTEGRAFYEYEKKMDILKYMNLEVKQEEKLRMLYFAYQKIKDKPEIFDKLSEKTKEYLKNLKYVPPEEEKQPEDKTVEDKKPTEETKTGEEVKPIDETKPAEEAKPIEEGKPAEEQNPTEEGKTIQEAKPVENETPAEEMKPVENETPAEEMKPVEDAKPVEESKPTDEQKIETEEIPQNTNENNESPEAA